MTNLAQKNLQIIKAFSLVEVAMAVAICSFALIAILGLFFTGIKSTGESQQEIQAANLASTLISMRMASPTNDIVNLPNFAIPTKSMTNLYAPVYPGNVSTNYLGSDGQTTSAANAVYGVTCQAGTNAVTGSGVAQVYLMLSWPPQINPTNQAAGRYELITAIPLR